MTDFSSRRSWGPSPRYDLVKNYKRKHDHKFTVISGPCSVESKEQIELVAKEVSKHATHLRGGLFRAGTYPGANFGMVNEKLVYYYREAAHHNKLKCIIEVLDYSDPVFTMVTHYADCLQVGCRSMQNYTLLRKVGDVGKPVFLKRHPGSTIDEFLGAAEHLLTAGCTELYLIERGSSTHMNHVRWDLSISIIPAIKALTQLPVIVDGSHGTGRRDLVTPMTLAGVAAGADGCLIETHPEPEKSLSDHDQALSFKQYHDLMFRIDHIRKALNELPNL